MLPLITQVDKINDAIIAIADFDLKAIGLCRTAVRNGEKQQFNAKTGEQVVIDDLTGSFIYHKITDKITFKKVNSPGTKNLYDAIAPMAAICYSNKQQFDDLILSGLSNIQLLTIINVDWDGYHTIQQETGKTDFDFNKYLFVVNYQILYKTDNCYDPCQ